MLKRFSVNSILNIIFDNGTLVFENADEAIIKNAMSLTNDLEFDKRTKQWRCSAKSYREIVLYFHKNKIPYLDSAKNYKPCELNLSETITPRTHQTAALKSWVDTGRHGVVELPTGAGKTILAILAITQVGRATLILVPTLDLMQQWLTVLKKYFDIEIGELGGGVHNIKEITVSTYDSASRYKTQIGNKFGFLIADECHHLPATHYSDIAIACLAPFRLGLSATVERPDGKHNDLFNLMGELVYIGEIHEMTESVLAPYEIKSLEIPLSKQEQELYLLNRSIYLDFVRKNRVNFSSRHGWMDFVFKASRLTGGKEAMQAYLTQKKTAQSSTQKLLALFDIIKQHRSESIIVFTQDNDTAYKVGESFIAPVLTHLTKPKERKKMLDYFRNGKIKLLVTSKVLNEGVDVPEASVAVIMSGSGAVREHVQRLGRILRHRPDKKAILYELISKDTSEYYVNQRRKQHNAYKTTTKI